MADTSVKGQLDAIKAVVDLGATAAALATVDGVVDSILATMALPKIVRKEYTFSTLTTGAVGAHTIFTVTGAVKVKFYAVCTTGLTPAVAGATISLGVVGTVAQFIAATTAADLLAGELWYDASPTTVIDTDAAVIAGTNVKTVIGDGADIIIDVATQAVASGVVEIMCEWEPITANGNVVAA
jgi:hypothetical protein